MGKFAWFLLGIILGAALALAAVTLLGRGPGAGREEAPAVLTRIPAAPDPRSAEKLLAPAPTPPPVRPHEPTPGAVSPADDAAQVAEDAAAAGMTSRSRGSEPASAPEQEPPPQR